MASAQLHGLVFWLLNAILVGLIARSIWRRRQIRQMRAAAVEDALSKMFKRAPEGWTFDSPYPRIFSQRRWTYLLTDAQKESLAERLRRGVQTTYLVAIGLCVVLVATPSHSGSGSRSSRTFCGRWWPARLPHGCCSASYLCC